MTNLAFISFTDTFFGFTRRHVTLSQLMGRGAGELQFWFGCAREHVLNSDVDLAPFEVSWANANKKKIHYDARKEQNQTCNASQVDPDVWRDWRVFRELLLEVEPEKLVHWNTPFNYPQLRDALLAKYRVWYRGWSDATGAPMMPANQATFEEGEWRWRGGRNGRLPIGTRIVSITDTYTVEIHMTAGSLSFQRALESGKSVWNSPYGNLDDDQVPSTVMDAFRFFPSAVTA